MSKNKGSFACSIDLELGWGIWDRINSSSLKKISDLERPICNNLLNIFEENNLPVTWAVVAALLDNKNKMISNNNADQNAWYAPDIVNKILTSKTKHLIASHSYSHKEFQNISKEETIEDFEKSIFFFNLINEKPDVLIFPRNQVFHLNILKQFGFNTYRSVDKNWYRKIYDYNKYFGKISNLIDKVLPLKSYPIEPKIDNYGLLEIPSSVLLIGRNGIRQIVSNYSMFKKIKNGIDLAIKNKECFHIWFHPSNFYYKPKSQFDLLKKIINYVNFKKEQDLIEIKLLNEFN